VLASNHEINAKCANPAVLDETSQAMLVSDELTR
jgi:hypothetical protein